MEINVYTWTLFFFRDAVKNWVFGGLMVGNLGFKH